MMKILLLVSCLAALSAAELFQIKVLIERPDTYSSLVADLDELERTHFRVSRGFSASVDVEGVYCQAFSGPVGRDELGGVFTAGETAVFTESDSEPVEIGSFLCSRDMDNLEGPGLRAPTEDEEADSGKETASTAVVQFRTGFADFTKDEVPLNELFETGPSKLGGSIIEAMVVSTGNGVKCQLFGDAQGEQKLGDAFSTMEVSFGREPVTVGAIRCQP
ncbi:uncharacterized protein GIQ15_06969 [Arthroderma uncinatum]|uniref:uncharacterized protein n=1 Tax=Arthroderma uncinatum TaxID=74035 RepID=UPI00144ACB5C|nr:uncharacterized protein GIQ15_06969 [Arthroderma uncinatum]KAF3479993.1 hypothetical protein GIQ15_06969 [Arthroderma uncinatum]